VTAAFLNVNGYLLDFQDSDAFQFLIGLYETGTFKLDKLDTWLRHHVVKADV
jgi:prophage maintenance system killer protein